MINILDYEMLGFEEYVSSTAIVLEKHREYEMLKGIKWYFIELPKFRKKNKDMNDRLNQWLAFIDDYDRGLVKMAEEKNKTIKRAREEMNYLTGDAEMKRLAELRERWEMDYNSAQIYALEQGIKEGREKGIKQGMKEGMEQGIKEGMEQGIKEGIEQGMKEGIEQGIKEGEKNKQVEIAKKLLKEKMPKEKIMEITGLSKEDIDKLT